MVDSSDQIIYLKKILASHLRPRMIYLLTGFFRPVMVACLRFLLFLW